MFDPYKIRKDFPMYINNIKMQGKNLVFLDNASTTFKPKEVVDACNYYNCFETSNSGRGDYDIMYNVDQHILETRKTVAKFINCDAHEVIFTANDTMSLNMIAFGFAKNILSKEDEILLSVEEHASNILPWFKLAEEIGCKINYVELDKNGRITIENVKKAITKNTKIISLACVSNVMGFKIDIKSISKIAHENGIIVVCDGAQSVPHSVTDVKDMDVDFLAFSGHKMCGPTGIGVLYAKAEYLEKMDAVFLGGGMNAEFYKDGKIDYRKAPAKFEAGTLNIEGIYGLNAAIKYLMKIGLDNIAKHESDLRAYAINKMKDVKDIIIYNESAESGIITFNIEGVFAQDLATLLNSKGIAVRSGTHCAKILPDFLHEVATVRASLYFYNTKEDIDALVDALKNGGDFLDAYFA